FCILLFLIVFLPASPVSLRLLSFRNSEIRDLFHFSVHCPAFRAVRILNKFIRRVELLSGLQILSVRCAFPLYLFAMNLMAFLFVSGVRIGICTICRRLYVPLSVVRDYGLTKNIF
uniref:Uncharacterized protein n=1 Tax=Parascaris univalens TaxID=6257 RepID=A0A915B129_PARUN